MRPAVRVRTTVLCLGSSLLLPGCGNEVLFAGPPAVVNGTSAALCLEMDTRRDAASAYVRATIPPDGCLRLSPISNDWDHGTVTLRYRRESEPDAAAQAAVIVCGRPMEVYEQGGTLALRELAKNPRDPKRGFLWRGTP